MSIGIEAKDPDRSQRCSRERVGEALLRLKRRIVCHTSKCRRVEECCGGSEGWLFHRLRGGFVDDHLYGRLNKRLNRCLDGRIRCAVGASALETQTRAYGPHVATVDKFLTIKHISPIPMLYTNILTQWSMFTLQRLHRPEWLLSKLRAQRRFPLLFGPGFGLPDPSR